jgi:hypothetical protein
MDIIDRADKAVDIIRAEKGSHIRDVWFVCMRNCIDVCSM